MTQLESETAVAFDAMWSYARTVTYEIIEKAFDEWRKTLTVVDRPSNQEIFSQGYVAGWNASEASAPAQRAPDYFEVAGKLGAALVQIADMDPKECRADDLGRAARIAREALSVTRPERPHE